MDFRACNSSNARMRWGDYPCSWRFFDKAGKVDVPIPSEYSDFEDALALARPLPTLVVGEQGMPIRGILSQLGGTFVIQVPMPQYREWIDQKELLREPPAQEWLQRIRQRHDVFFGYCSKANKLAKDIKTYLEGEGLRVLDWATAFRPGRTIMEEVRRRRQCAGAGSSCLLRMIQSKAYRPRPQSHVTMSCWKLATL